VASFCELEVSLKLEKDGNMIEDLGTGVEAGFFLGGGCSTQK